VTLQPISRRMKRKIQISEADELVSAEGAGGVVIFVVVGTGHKGQVAHVIVGSVGQLFGVGVVVVVVAGGRGRGTNSSS